MKTEILEGDNSDVFFATGIEMLMYAGESGQRKRAIMEDIHHYSGDYTPWGDDNLHPQNTREKIEKNDTASAVLEWKAKALTSGGMQYGFVSTDDLGQDKYEPQEIPEIEDFLDMIEHEEFIYEAVLDFYTHNNFFPCFNLNLRREVTDMYSFDAEHVRLGLQHKTGRNKGKFTNAYVSGDWEFSANSAKAEEIAAIDPYSRVVQQFKERKGHWFNIPIRPQVRGRLAYAKGNSDFLINSGWLDISQQIPKWKKAIMERQLGVQYHLEVEKRYWENRWKNWKDFSPQKQKQLKKETYAEFIKFFKGAEAAGNVLITDYHYVEHGGGSNNQWSEWKVTKLDNNLFGDGAHIEESIHSDNHIFRAYNVDHTLIGLTPSKGFSSGSGSDKRVAFNQYVLLTQPEQRRILRPFEYVAKLNNWHEKYGKGRRLKFWFKNTFIATLDHGKDTKPANDNNTKKT